LLAVSADSYQSVATGSSRHRELQDYPHIVALFIEQSGVDDDRTPPRYAEAVSSSWRDAWSD